MAEMKRAVLQKTSLSCHVRSIALQSLAFRGEVPSLCFPQESSDFRFISL